MTEAVRYESDGTVATITMDDGKVNALGFTMFAALDTALDRAEDEQCAVVFTGRDGVFSAGFDLKVLGAFSNESGELLGTGLAFARRVFMYPRPVVMACSGHTFAMGLFLALTGDHRMGVTGADHKITANEVKIGMTMPRAATEISRARVAPQYLERVLVQAEVFTPDTAVTAGILDAVAAPGQLLETAQRTAAELAALDPRAYAGTKHRVRNPLAALIAAAFEADQADMRAAMGNA